MKSLFTFFRKITITCIIILCILTLISIIYFAFCNTPAYAEIFQKSLSLDGAPSDSYAMALKKLFDQETDAFISALNEQSDNICNNVIPCLIAETKAEKLDDLTACFASYQDNPQYARLLSIFETHMQQRLLYEESKASAPSETVQSYGFDPEKIKTFIDLDLELGGDDDEYKQVIANAYLADPILLAELIQDYPSEKATVIIDSINAGLKLLNKEPLTINDTTIDANILNILNALQKDFNSK